MKRSLLALCLSGFVVSTGCTTSSGGRLGVRTAPQSERSEVEPRNASWWRQDLILKARNECAPQVRFYTIDHTDSVSAGAVLMRDSSTTIQLLRPLNAGRNGYGITVTAVALDQFGTPIGSVEGGPWYVDSNNAGYEVAWTVRSLDGGAQCPPRKKPSD